MTGRNAISFLGNGKEILTFYLVCALELPNSYANLSLRPSTHCDLGLQLTHSLLIEQKQPINNSVGTYAAF